MKKSTLWTRPFVALAGVNFFSILTFFLLTIKTTEYALNEFSVSYDIAGASVSVYVFGALAMRLVLGRKMDRWGVRKTLFGGCLLNATASLLYLAPIDFASFLTTRIIHGFSMALVTTSAAAGAALIVPPDRRAEGIGYFTLSQALATGIGPFAGIALTSSAGSYEPMFYFTAVTGVTSLAAFFLVSVPPVATAAEDPSARQDAESQSSLPARAKAFFESMVQISILPLCASILLTFVCYSGILGFLTVYASGKELDSAVSVYFALYSAVILASRPPMGRLVDRKGENSAMYAAFAVFSASFVVLAFANTGATLLLSAALLGFGNGVTQAVVQAIIARLTPPQQMGRANSTLFLCMDIGSGVGPIIIGAVIMRVGYTPAYLCLAGVALVAMFTYHVAHGSKPIARANTDKTSKTTA